MKYFLFGYGYYTSNGGAGAKDFIKSFDSLEDAKLYAEREDNDIYNDTYNIALLDSEYNLILVEEGTKDTGDIQWYGANE